MQAVIFPGQGAQYLGMGKDLWEKENKAKQIFQAVDEISGMPISEYCFFGPEEILRKTDIQQLAILTVSIACYEVLRARKEFNFSFAAGLSLGEYSCLYAANVLSLEELVILVKERGQAMQEAAEKNPSTMLAIIGIEKENLKPFARDFFISNLNAPGQVVVSCAKDKQETIKEMIFSNFPNCRIVQLEVSGGFHSPFMQPAYNRLAKVVEKMNFRDATIPIVSNYTAQAHTQAEEIKENLLNQLCNPVRWNECVLEIKNKGVNLFYELGPSKILKGLIRKIDQSLKVINIGCWKDIDMVANSN